VTTTPVLSQSHFRGRSDSSSVETAPTWIAAVDTNFSVNVDTTFRIRFCIQETAGGNPAAHTVKLQANKNGGAFQDVTTGSTIVKAVDASSDADEAAVTTARLGGTGTYVTGRYSEDGSTSTSVDLAANNNTEYEFGVQIVGSSVAFGDKIQLKVVALSGTSITATTTPTITASCLLVRGDLTLTGRAAKLTDSFAGVKGDLTLSGNTSSVDFLYYYWVGGTATWDGTAGSKWSYQSGGTGGAPVPDSTHSARFDANSGSGTVTLADITGYDCLAKSVICTGYTGTLAVDATNGSRIKCYGDFTAASGMTLTLPAGKNLSLDFYGNGVSHTLTSAGKSFRNYQTGVIVSLFGDTSSSLSIADSLTGYQINPRIGTFTWGNFDHYISVMQSVGDDGAVTINWGTGTVELYTFTGNSANITINPSSGTVYLRNVIDGNSAYFYGYGKTWNNIKVGYNTGGSAASYLYSGFTCNDLYWEANTNQKYEHGKTFAITSLSMPASGANAIAVDSDDGVNTWTISDSSGTNDAYGCTITRSSATGGATFNSYTTNGNVNGGSNTGWLFTATTSFTVINGEILLSSSASSIVNALLSVKGDLAISGKIIGIADAFATVKGGLSLSGQSGSIQTYQQYLSVKGDIILTGSAGALATAFGGIKGDLSLTGSVSSISVGLTLTSVVGNLVISGNAAKIAEVFAGIKGDLVIAGQAGSISQGQQYTLIKGDLVLAGKALQLADALGGVFGGITISGRSLATTAAFAGVKGDLLISGKPAPIVDALGTSTGTISLSGGAGAIYDSLEAPPALLTLSGAQSQAAFSMLGVKGDIYMSGASLSVADMLTVIKGSIVLNGLDVSYLIQSQGTIITIVDGQIAVTGGVISHGIMFPVSRTITANRTDNTVNASRGSIVISAGSHNGIEVLS